MPTYKHPRPAIAVDTVVFGLDSFTLNVLLVRRAEPPFKEQLALPGGFVGKETLYRTALSKVTEETGAILSHLEQLEAFDDLKRDPRERVITITYMGLVQTKDKIIRPGKRTKDAIWQDVSSLKDNVVKDDETGKEERLAFDHGHIIEEAIKRLRAKIRNTPIGFDLLPKEFTLAQLLQLYGVITGKNYDRSNFRKKILSLDILTKSTENKLGVALYSFDKKKYEAASERGINFEI